MCNDVSVGGEEFVFRGAIKLAGLHRKRWFVLRGSWLGGLHIGGLYREQLWVPYCVLWFWQVCLNVCLRVCSISEKHFDWFLYILDKATQDEVTKLHCLMGFQRKYLNPHFKNETLEAVDSEKLTVKRCNKADGKQMNPKQNKKSFLLIKNSSLVLLNLLCRVANSGINFLSS